MLYSTMEERLKLVSELWTKGVKLKEIAERLNISVSTVRRYVRKLGLQPRFRKIKGTSSWDSVAEQVVELWHKGAKVSDIARSVGVSKATIYSYLRHLGLKRQRPANVKVNEEKLREMVEMLESGATITEIARKLGVSRHTVQRHLKLICPSGLNGCNRRKLEAWELERAAEMWRAGAKLKEIAEHLGVSVYTVYLHLKKMGLINVNRRKISEDKIKQIAEMRLAGAKLKEIAERLNVKEGAVRYYLRKMGLTRSVKRKVEKKMESTGSVKRKVDENKLKQMVDLWHEGLTLKEIARQVGLNVYTVMDYLHKMGLKRRIRYPKPRISREELEALSKKYTDREIAEMYKVSKIYVYKLRRMYGIAKELQPARGETPTEVANTIIEALKEKCYITNRDLLKMGVVLDRRILKTLSELSSDVRRVKLKITSTSKYMVLQPRINGMSILYLPGCEDAVAELIVSNMVDLNVPRASITSLLKANGAPQELVEAVLKRVQSSVANRTP